jgi:saccharopine dehydrogenase (NADP+, L-glutamate forming)
LIGAGRSSTALIDYLLHHAAAGNWELTVGDFSEQAVREKTKGHPASRPIRFDINDRDQTLAEVGRADLVISLLPAHMHISVARMCVSLGKHLVTASYVTPEMESLREEAVSKGVILLNECGLDPGIDHMSAMEIIRAIRSEGGELNSFYSYTGGLVAPESNDNPWGYKFSWNPRNVILAGQGTARYIENGRFKYIPYNRLFRRTETIEVEGVGRFDGYANRDSLSYRKTYGLEASARRGTFLFDWA